MLKTSVGTAVGAARVGSVGPGRWRSAAFAMGAAAVVLVAGCSSSSSTTESSTTSAASAAAVSAAASSAASSAGPSSSAELCAATDQLKASLSALVSPALLTGGVAGIKTAVATVQSSLEAVTTTAKSDYQPEVSAVRSSLARLQTSVGSLGNGGGTIAGLTTVATDIGAVGTSTTALLAQLKSRCGS